MEVLTVLYRGKDLLGWFGGDGTRIPVWETGKEARAEAKAFLKDNKFHKPVLIKATISY